MRQSVAEENRNEKKEKKKNYASSQFSSALAGNVHKGSFKKRESESRCCLVITKEV